MKTNLNYKFHPYINEYMHKIETGKIPASKEIKKVMPYTRYKLDYPDVILKNQMIKKGVELTEKYFEMKLPDWELFIFALIHSRILSTIHLMHQQKMVRNLLT